MALILLEIDYTNVKMEVFYWLNIFDLINKHKDIKLVPENRKVK